MTSAPDPLPWLKRLLDVNAGSDFTSEQKIVIASAIRQAMQKLGGAALSAPDREDSK